MGSDKGPAVSISEVGSNGSQHEESPSDVTNTAKFLTNMEALLSRVLAIPPTQIVSTNSAQLLQFNPDEPDSDIDGWCNLTEVIIKSKRLEGVELLIALTSALKGRAAACLTKLNLNEITWSLVKQTLIARFSKPKLFQDYFDDILRFQIDNKETASESALRLWNLIERIPQTILSGVSFKRRLDVTDLHEPDSKLPRMTDRFIGKCHYCGVPGHRQAECRKRRDDFGTTKLQDGLTSSRPQEMSTTVTCFVCNKPGHVATFCPDKRNGGGAAVKEVHLCDHRPSRGTLTSPSGQSVSFLFDSGSSCSLLRESFLLQTLGYCAS